MGERPTGTVVFLFTDIEGSTRLWEQHPDEMQVALEAHDRMLNDAIEAAGAEFRTGGYANAFPRARDDGYAANEVIFDRRHELTPERYADDVAGWVAGGASIVGGCCDIGPDHMAAVASSLA